MTTTAGGVSYGRALELKTRDEGWTVEGHVSVFGNVDAVGDVVVPGAYKATLADKHPVRFLFSHQPDKVLGRTLELYEDQKGLFGRFKLSRTSLGQDVRQLLLDGAVDSFSVGYVARDWSTDQKSGVRSLRAIDLLECSVVALPANVEARVSGVKGRRAPTHPLVRDLEGVIVRLRRKRLIASLSDAELRGYGQMVRWRVEHRAERLAAGGR